jgi:DNA-binding NarL/FixJ family response regulator
MDKKQLLLVDDHQLVLDGIISLLANESDYEIAGEVTSGQEALAIIKSKPIDIVVTDVKMPHMSGIELTKTIKRDFPEIKVLVLTMFAESGIVTEIMMAEAEGYLLKNCNKAELLKALKQIAGNGTYYSQEIVSGVMKKMKHEYLSKLPKTSLSDREIEIIRLICNEYSSSQIAEKLSLSQHTVDTHRKNILRKTDVKTIIGLVKYSLTHGYIDFS